MKKNQIIAHSFAFLSLVLLLTTTACETKKTVVKTPPRPAQPPKSKPVEPPKEEAYKVAVKFTKSILLDEAMARAQRENKPVFIDFYTDWCAPCKLMDEYVFTEPYFAAYLNSNFVNYKFDGGNFEADAFLKRFGVKKYPTLMFIRADGKIIMSYEGGKSHSEMKAMAEEALRKFRSGN